MYVLRTTSNNDSFGYTYSTSAQVLRSFLGCTVLKHLDSSNALEYLRTQGHIQLEVGQALWVT